VDLPLTTRMLIGVSNYLRAWGIETVIAVALLIALLLYIRSRFEGARTLGDRILLYIPLANGISRSYNMSNFTRTFGLLLKSGVRITEAMDIVAGPTTTRLYRAAYEKASQSLTRGEPLSRTLGEYPQLFPDVALHMIVIGEKTGNLSNTLIYLSELYEAE